MSGPLKSKLKVLSAQAASAVDAELMSTGGFSIDQLVSFANVLITQLLLTSQMELAGLSVAEAVYKQQPPTPTKNKVLVLAGPGNNGGDGLVAARHLSLFGYKLSVYYPKRSKGPLFDGLITQLNCLDVDFVENIDTAYKEADHIIDALFGFSFKPPVRGPFPRAIELMKTNAVPVTSVDIPSGWDVDQGPLDGDTFMPTALVSLTAPKPAATYFTGRHFQGGRFVSKKFADKYGFNIPDYRGTDQVVEL